MRSSITFSAPISRGDSSFSQIGIFEPPRSSIVSSPPVLISNSSSIKNGINCIEPSTKALLAPNKQYLFPHNRCVNLSPYEINENPFTDIHPSQLLNSFSSSSYPRTACPSPRSASKNSAEKLVGIDNFDPNSLPIQFNEPYTIKAIKQLGIQQSDLFFPSSENLDRIGGDRKYFRELLTQRALKYAEDVKKERQKIMMDELFATEDNNSSSSSDNNTNTTNNNHKRSKSENRAPPIGVKCTLKLQTQRSAHSETTARLRQAIDRATKIEEQQMQEKIRRVELIERRHELLRQEKEAERLKSAQTLMEKNEKLKMKSQLFSQKQRENQIMKIVQYEKNVLDRKVTNLPTNANTYYSSTQVAPMTSNNSTNNNNNNNASISQNEQRPQLLSQAPVGQLFDARIGGGGPQQGRAARPKMLNKMTFVPPDQFHVA